MAELQPNQFRTPNGNLGTDPTVPYRGGERLLHGSTYDIPDGGVVRPTSQQWTKDPVAYATSDEYLASNYGHHTGTPVREGGRLFAPRVYEVEPIANDAMKMHGVKQVDNAGKKGLEIEHQYPWPDAVSSKTGFRVKGVAKWRLWNDDLPREMGGRA